MRSRQKRLLRKRDRLLEKMARLSLVIKGSYLERFSTCTRPNCACHKGKKHGPRSYVVLYQEKKQRQVYVPKEQREVIRQGIDQHKQLEAMVKEITRINLQLMREGSLEKSISRKGGKRHE